MSEKHFLVIDFSNVLSMCWYPALDAEDAGKAALEKHLIEQHCTRCSSTDWCSLAPKQYDAKEVLLVNLDGKMGTLLGELDRYGLNSFHVVFVEDRHAKAKFALYPEYKAGRDKSRPKPPRDIAKEHLKSRGYKQWVHSPDHEADDAIAAFVKKTRGIDTPAIIVSGDKDLWQLLSPPKVAVYNPYTNRFVDTQEDVPKKFGVSDAKYIPLVKSLWGDTSDNIPNVVPRMQKQLVPVIERTDGTLESFYQNVQETALSGRCQELLAQANGRVGVNYALVRLDPDCPIEFDPL